MEFIHFLVQNPYLDVTVLASVTYIVRLFLSPSKYEAKIASKVVITLVMFGITLIKKWYLKHPETMSKHLDGMYSHVFHSKHYFKNEESAKIIVG